MIKSAKYRFELQKQLQKRSTLFNLNKQFKLFYY